MNENIPLMMATPKSICTSLSSNCSIMRLIIDFVGGDCSVLVPYWYILVDAWSEVRPSVVEVVSCRRMEGRSDDPIWADV